MPKRSQSVSPQANLPLLKYGRPVCRADGPRRGVESRHRGRRIVKATTTPPTNPHPNSPPQPGMEAPEKPSDRHQGDGQASKPEPKSTAAPEQASGKSKESSRECQNRGRHTHNTQPRGPHPKSHLPTQGYLRSGSPPPYRRQLRMSTQPQQQTGVTLSPHHRQENTAPQDQTRAQAYRTPQGMNRLCTYTTLSQTG